MAITKSFQDLGAIYENSVFLTESNASQDKMTVGKKPVIGDVKLVKEGGDEKVKKDLIKPSESKTPDGKPEDGDKALSQNKKTVTESKSKIHMKKSLFNTVYNQIVSEDADVLSTDDPVSENDGDGLDDPIAPDAGVTPEEEVIDPATVVREICALTDKLKKHFGITDDCGTSEGEVSVDIADDVPAVGEAVDMKELPDSAGKSMQSKKIDTGGVKVVNKKADGKVTAGDGKIEKAPDGQKLAGNKADGKVKGDGAAVKGNNASAFE